MFYLWAETLNMSIPKLEQEVIEEFEFFDSWLEKYEHIIELGKDLPLIPDHLKTGDNLIKGCQSNVWLHAEYEENKITFCADSDAIITKGIIALLIRILDKQSPNDILKAELKFIDSIGLTNHLSPTRANGLLGMVKQMKSFAMAFSLKNNTKNG